MPLREIQSIALSPPRRIDPLDGFNTEFTRNSRRRVSAIVSNDKHTRRRCGFFQCSEARPQASGLIMRRDNYHRLDSQAARAGFPFQWPETDKQLEREA